MSSSLLAFRGSMAVSVTRTQRFLSSAIRNQYLVVNALGEDRSGIVADMTKLITDVGGNVGESKAMKLGSHFSLMMLVSVPNTTVESLKASLDSVSDIKTLTIETCEPQVEISTPVLGYSGIFRLTGANNPGIVYNVTRLLAENGLNIDNLSTSEEEAPFGGTTLFMMEGLATVSSPLPKSFDEEAIQEKLRNLGDSLNCDITLEQQRGEDEESHLMYG